jgi:GNAT superfamily N-acetyltransferase
MPTVRQLDGETHRRDAVPLLAQLWTDFSEKELFEWTGAEDYHLFGCFADGELVGVAGALVREVLHHRQHLWLYDLVVDEARRGEGYGTALVRHLETWADEQGCESVALASPLRKEGTHAFYEELGYEKWGYVVEKGLAGGGR